MNVRVFIESHPFVIFAGIIVVRRNFAVRIEFANEYVLHRSGRAVGK